jgi:glycerol-3-phosphate cytidylyltransferase/D-beta-D-heptose 7-phosphate kinase/D-beta-D-heptose 1-phosphate adenosyltransferase
MKNIVIISGYFNPLHMGHVLYVKAAKKLGDHLVVIINNDQQQKLKKGKIIMEQDERAFVVEALGHVDEVIVSIDKDSSVVQTLKLIAEKYKDHKIIFANGGDRESEKDIPEDIVCKEYNIEMVFSVGGREKANSSSNINKRLGLE